MNLHEVAELIVRDEVEAIVTMDRDMISEIFWEEQGRDVTEDELATIEANVRALGLGLLGFFELSEVRNG